MPSLSIDRDQVMRMSSRRRLVLVTSLVLFCSTLSICFAQPQSILCTDGEGKFDAETRTGVRVQVGASRDGELATRACAAKLGWEKQELIVATGVSQLDLDAFGVDFGDKVPTAAFQIKRSGADCCMQYQIYSLEKPPRLLRTIVGGDFFNASDKDLDGKVEIWTKDAAGVNGFENISLGELDSAPTVVFRFTHDQLLDVSAEFQSYFDDEITRIRAGIKAGDLEDFKNSDGKLSVTPSISPEKLHRLRLAKIKVLEIVWAYLYSGREQDAWRSLGEMWPQADVDRIRAALANTHARGIRAQADATPAGAPRGRKKHAQIFDAVSRSGPGRKLEVTPPGAILLQRPPVSELQEALPESELLLDLVIDAAGKVRSVEPAMNAKGKGIDSDLINAALAWRFIPALKDGRPVACRLRLAVSSKK